MYEKPNKKRIRICIHRNNLPSQTTNHKLTINIGENIIEVGLKMKQV